MTYRTHMKTLYSPCLAALFAVILYFGYGTLGGVLGSWLLGSWMADWGSFSFAPPLLVSLAVACSAGLLVGLPFGALVSNRPLHWAVLISVAVIGFIAFTHYPALFWQHYFAYASLIVAFVMFSWAGFVAIRHPAKRSNAPASAARD